jgi:MFS family permease
MLHADSSGPDDPKQNVVVPGAGIALTLLLAINLFNYIDRQVLAAVEPEIRRELLGGGEVDIRDELLGISQAGDSNARTMMGLLSTAFLLTYMLSAPLFGWLAERMSRWWIVGIGVALWSLASGASGFEWPVASLTVAFWLLFCTRLFVGVGEGAYGPVAPTMISDMYPVKKRGQVIAWFYLAIPIGGALGYAWGDLIRKAIDWRWAFYLVMPPGLLLGALCFFLREPPRGKADAVKETQRQPTWYDYVYILKIPSYTINTVAMTLMMFGLGGLGYWMPDYLDEKVNERVRTAVLPGGDPEQFQSDEGRRQLKEVFDRKYAGDTGTADLKALKDREEQATGLCGLGPRTTFGVLTAVSGLIATLLGGLAGDWLRPRVRGAYFLVSGLTMILGFPMLLLFLKTPFPIAWLFGFVAVFALFFSTGPTNTILANVTHPALRAGAFALNILLIHAFGDAISPPVLGFVAGQFGMSTAFIVVSFTMVIGGLLWMWGARYLDEDTRLAASRLPETDPHLTGGKMAV